MNGFFQREATHLNLLDDVRANTLRRQQRQMVISHEWKLVVVRSRIIAHCCGADRVGADSIGAGEQQFWPDWLCSLDPGAFAAAIGFDTVDQTEVNRSGPEQIGGDTWHSMAPSAG